MLLSYKRTYAQAYVARLLELVFSFTVQKIGTIASFSSLSPSMCVCLECGVC